MQRRAKRQSHAAGMGSYHFLVGLAAFCLIGCGVNHGLDVGPPDGTGIRGALVFHGIWPGETADVAVAVYKKRPQELTDFFDIAGWDTTVTLGASRFEYTVPLEEPGSYEWVVVAWRPQGGFWDFTSLLGCYHVAPDTLPTPVEVRLGETTKNIDIQAHLDLVRGVDLPDREICTGFLPPLPDLGLKPTGGAVRYPERPGHRR
ncbi:MAG: hypothetical protein QGI83_13610 [Candidatus Latescibacteria bacterium]|nr:hypothetical protein [Candidatus Latescibacterota bacterium]